MVAPKKPHVLIAEDDTFLAHIYQEAFEGGGFRVSVAYNGESALRDIKKKMPQLIVLDILLPKKDGFTILEALNADKKVAHITVVVVTNLGQREDVEKGKKLGASAYLIKGHCTSQDVLHTAQRLL